MSTGLIQVLKIQYLILRSTGRDLSVRCNSSLRPVQRCLGSVTSLYEPFDQLVFLFFTLSLFISKHSSYHMQALCPVRGQMVPWIDINELLNYAPDPAHSIIDKNEVWHRNNQLSHLINTARNDRVFTAFHPMSCLHSFLLQYASLVSTHLRSSSLF